MVMLMSISSALNSDRQVDDIIPDDWESFLCDIDHLCVNGFMEIPIPNILCHSNQQVMWQVIS